MADYNIYVRDQRANTSNTEVNLAQGQSNTEMPPSIQGMSAKSLASIAAVANTVETIGKTWLDIKTSRKGAAEAAKLNATFKLLSYAGALAVNPVVGATYIAGDLITSGMREQEERRKYDVNRNYIINKLNLDSNSNSRYRGGKI